MATAATEAKGTGRYRVLWGLGAGAGGALAMLLVMALMRWLLGFPTLPEIMINAVLQMLGGRAFSDLLDRFYYSGLPLYFTLVLEGVLLVGALLGLLYAWLARPVGSGQWAVGSGERASPPATSNPQFAVKSTSIFRAPLGGLLFGGLIALVLNGLFLPLVGQDPFAGEFKGIVAQTDVPPWLGLSFMAQVFGLVTHLLLPKAAPVGSEAMEADAGRRQALRVAGGTLLALLGGGAFWYGGTLLRQGGLASPVSRKPETVDVASGEVDVQIDGALADDTPTPEPTRPTATPQPPPSPTPQPPPPTTTQEPPTPEPAAPTATLEPMPTDTPVPPTPEATSTLEPASTNTPAIAAAHPPVAIPISEITPTPSFYHVSKNVFDPRVSVAGWKLSIKGLVENPFTLTYDELTAMPAETVTTGMMCISNPIGGGLIGSTNWRGVHLADLLKRAKPRKGAVDLLMTAADGYSDSITLQKGLDPDVMLVWEMGGEKLTPEHGFPVRLLVPGIYGMKHIKWIQSIELVNHDYKGYWQQPAQGWSDPAPVNTMSRIDFPAGGTITRKAHIISGIAFAGDRSISKVELSFDGGKSWQPAYLKPPLSGTSWAVWGYSWTPTKAGKYTVTVRAYDGAGKAQPAKVTDPYPNGATGYHMVTYQVK